MRRRKLPWIMVFACSVPGCGRRVKEQGTAAVDASASTAASKQDVRDAADENAPRLEPLPDDAPFQGIVTLETRFGREAPQARYVFTLKGKKARWDLLSQGQNGQILGYRVYDGEQHKFFTMATARQTVLVTRESELLKGDAAPPTHEWTWKPLAVEPRGSLLGYSCERESTHDDDFEYDICATDKLVSFPMQALAGPLTSVVPFNGSLVDKGLFPLFVTLRRLQPAPGQAVGTAAGILRVLHIDRGKIADSAFDVPSWPRVDAVTLDFGRPAQK